MLTFDQIYSNLIAGVNLILSEDLLSKILLDSNENDITCESLSSYYDWSFINNKGLYWSKDDVKRFDQSFVSIIIIKDFNCKIKDAKGIFDLMLNSDKKFVLTIDTRELVDELIYADTEKPNLIAFKTDRIMPYDLIYRSREYGINIME